MGGAFSGKAAIVTGAGMGIGRAVALAFAREGVGVVVADINAAAGQETVELVQGVGAKGVFVSCDVSKEEDVEAMVEAAIAEFGRLDYACNNAGIVAGPPIPFAKLEQPLWDRVMDVNLRGVFLCMKHELSAMEKQGSGAIVNVASLASLLCEPGSPIYTAAKHGVMGLTKTAAFEYVKRGIRVNGVCPAPVDTPMLRAAPKEVFELFNTLLPMGRPATAEEVAGAVMYLCSDIASYVTGTGIVIDGGASLV